MQCGEARAQHFVAKVLEHLHPKIIASPGYGVVKNGGQVRDIQSIAIENQRIATSRIRLKHAFFAYKEFAGDPLPGKDFL